VDFSLNLVARAAALVRRHATPLLALALLVLLLQDIFGTHGVMSMTRSQKEAREVEQEIQRLDEENRQLQERVKALETDPAAVERIAREEMGLARPGELIFKLPAKPSEATDSNGNRAPERPQK
jgi:cell division protein FtsB